MKRSLFSLLLVLLLATRVFAHPETGFLPDAVAEVEYKMVVEINPRDTATRNKLGIVLYRKNKLQEAENQFIEVLKIAPGDFDAHDGMGLVKIKQRNYPLALSWIQKAISLSANDAMVRYNLGFVYEQMGRYREAEVAYRQAQTINENNLRRGGDQSVAAGKKKIIDVALQGIAAKLKSTASGRR
jgi:tetratricopeptide (TPR) repeat protein